jgi:hypothetical protein
MTVGIGEAVVGRIIHYYPRINVGIVELTSGEINVGDLIQLHKFCSTRRFDANRSSKR